MSSKSSPVVRSGSLASKASILLGVVYFILLFCVIGYVWGVAQDRFVTIAAFKISRQSSPGGEVGIAQLALPGLADSGLNDSQIAIGFIDSADLLIAIEQEFNLHEHYSSPEQDFIFRLEADASLEDRLKFYRKRISAHFDTVTGLTNLTVDTFDPKMSRDVAESLLKRCESFVNTINQTIANQQMTFIRGELERAENHVAKLSAEMLELQNANNILTPDSAISESHIALQELKMERLRAETSVTSLERDSPGSPRIPILRSQLRSLEEQISVESAKLSGPDQDNLNQVLFRFKELQTQLDFAIQIRAGTETLFERNRVDAAATSRFLSIIQHPYLPEDPTYPARTYATATILVLGVLVFLMLRVFIHSVYERQN